MSEPAVATAPKPSRMVPLMLGLNSLLLAGVLGAVLLRPQPAAPAPAVQAEAPKEGEGAAAAPVPGPIVSLGDFVVHLRNPEVDRYARMSFEVQLGSEADKEPLSRGLPQVRDAFIAYLSDRTLEELRGSEALARAKVGLHAELSRVVPRARVHGLYLTEFVVQ